MNANKLIDNLSVQPIIIIIIIISSNSPTPPPPSQIKIRAGSRSGSKMPSRDIFL
jgi:hypothetical protein